MRAVTLGHRDAARVARAVAALAALLTVLAVAAPSAGAQTRECFLLTHCTPVAGPWVVFSALDQPPVPAGTSVSCPDGADGMLLPVGSDYELQGSGPFLNVNVTRFMPGPGIGLING